MLCVSPPRSAFTVANAARKNARPLCTGSARVHARAHQQCRSRSSSKGDSPVPRTQSPDRGTSSLWGSSGPQRFDPTRSAHPPVQSGTQRAAGRGPCHRRVAVPRAMVAPGSGSPRPASCWGVLSHATCPGAAFRLPNQPAPLVGGKITRDLAGATSPLDFQPRSLGRNLRP